MKSYIISFSLSNHATGAPEDSKQSKLNFAPASLPIHSPPTDAKTALIQLICTARLPFSFVGDLSLDYFIRAVREDKDFKLPHRSTLAGSELTNCYNQVMEALKNEFERCGYLALTVDGTEMHGTSYWSVTLCGLDGDFQMHVAPIACVPAFKNHSGKNLASLVETVLSSLGVPKNKVVAICTDEGGGAPCIADFFPDAEAIFCAAHILQTCLRNAFDATCSRYPELGTTIALAKRIAARYNQSSIANAEITVLQSKLSESVSSLVQDVATRWLSHLFVLRSFQKHEEAVKAWLNSNSDGSRDLDIAGYNVDSFWPIVKYLITILELFEIATKIFSVEKEPSLHQVIRRVYILHKQLAREKAALPNRTSVASMPMFSYFIDSLDSVITAKFENWNPLELVAYFLDPDNRLPQSDVDKEIFNWAKETTLEVLNKRFPLTTSDTTSPQTVMTGIENFGDDLDRPLKILPSAALDEIATYCTIPVSSTSESLTEFWIRVKIQLHRLSSLALLVFSVPCSQTSSEREFSLLRLLCSHLRGRLDPFTTNMQLICSAFLNKRNTVLQKKHAGNRVRSLQNVEADKYRIASLLETNRRRAFQRASQNDSASQLLNLNLGQVLHDHRLPDVLGIEDIHNEALNPIKKVFLDIGDGEASDDEDFENGPPVPKRRKNWDIVDDTEIHLPSGSHRPAPGICKLSGVAENSLLLTGQWTCTDPNVLPTPSMIFRQFLNCVTIEPNHLTQGTDGKQFLMNKFNFTLVNGRKGGPKFNGRRGFIALVGENIQFGY